MGVETIRRLALSSPEPFRTDEVESSRATIEEAFSGAAAHQKFAMAMLDAVTHKAEAQKLRRPVAETRKGSRNEKERKSTTP